MNPLVSLLDPAEPALDYVGDLSGPELRAYLGRVWVGDQEGFLVDEARAILRGRIDGLLTEQHIEAICSANRRAVGVRQCAANQTGEMPF
jgi:hypothetical protein